MPKNLDKLTNERLKEYMQVLGLTVPENYRKADLIFAIREYYEAKTAEAATAETTTGLSPDEWTEIQQSGEADDLMTWYDDLPERASIGAKVKSKPPARMAWIPPPSSSSSSGPSAKVPAKTKAAALPKDIPPPPPAKSKGKGKPVHP